MGPEQDMLLFQWGTYDWGEGEHFEADLTRQFIVPGKGDDPALYQLSLTFRYQPSDQLRAVESGEFWCASREEAAPFLAMVCASPALAVAQPLKPASVSLGFERV
ncbi:hypothetical protein M0G41_05765 [Lysobacter sp. CAU 1642]|uniref:Uncharacterized protein n=2 Tax=Pseudomarimonas salicorniae TaxID=2933270 RepID=A0ABT0GGN5_9GAMM|nr:hypothetical protein [Lysobacter sp. CAU 1642]